MTYFNHLIKAGFLFLMGFAFLSQNIAQAQQSDYKIQKEFKEQLKDFQQKIEEADSTESLQSLMDEIDDYERNYEEHSELLNKVLYPETFDQKIGQLRKSSRIMANRLETIERQNEKLTTMETRLTGYEADLERLDRRSDSLQQAMQKSVQSEKQLSAMVRQYRESLEQRDELVLAFIDSLIVAYEQMNPDLRDTESTDKKSRFESEGNALKMLYAITDENIRILRSNSSKLRLEDYMRMAEVHNSFERMWQRLGDKISGIYQNKETELNAEQIDDNMNEWKNLLQDQTFSALHDTMNERGFRLREFSTSEGMYTTVTTFLDEQIEAGGESYERFNRFKEFWDEIELKWAPNLRQADILSAEQIAVINQKLDSWSQQAAPQSRLLVYLLGASVLAIFALGIFLVKEKRRKKQGTAGR